MGGSVLTKVLQSRDKSSTSATAPTVSGTIRVSHLHDLKGLISKWGGGEPWGPKRRHIKQLIKRMEIYGTHTATSNSVLLVDLTNQSQ